MRQALAILWAIPWCLLALAAGVTIIGLPLVPLLLRVAAQPTEQIVKRKENHRVRELQRRIDSVPLYVEPHRLPVTFVTKRRISPLETFVWRPEESEALWFEDLENPEKPWEL
jgi:hypothetical protein